MDDDARDRFDAMSAAEMREKVDLAVGYLRELRTAIAVSFGMKAEGAAGPVPNVDAERMQQVVAEVMELLPLLRRPLTPEEKARLRPFGPEQRALAEEIFADVEEDPEAFDEAMAEDGSELTAAQVLALREQIEKTDMLAEAAEEARLLLEELEAQKERLEEQANAIAARILSGGGES